MQQAQQSHGIEIIYLFNTKIQNYFLYFTFSIIIFPLTIISYCPNLNHPFSWHIIFIQSHIPQWVNQMI